MRRTATQFFDFVIPAAVDYEMAERALSEAFSAKDSDPGAYRVAERQAVRRASELAIALFSLVDRAASELGVGMKAVRAEIADGCLWNDAGPLRHGAESRIRSVADAYKHDNLDSGRGHTIKSADDILACGLGYGLDGSGVGKMGGPEVIITTADGTQRKFLGDVHVVLRSWKAFLEKRGVDVSSASFTI